MDLSGLSQRIQRFENSLRDKSDDEFFVNFKVFIETSKVRLVGATKRLADVEALRVKLSVYFCEEEKTFSMEECFKIFCAFLNSFKVAANVSFILLFLLYNRSQLHINKYFI